MATDQHVFSWKDFPKWEKFIQDIFAKNDYESLSEAIRKAKEKFEYANDSYFDELYKKFGDYSELIDNFLKQFFNKFNFIKMYHCCRPLDVQSYYDFGIKVLDMSDMNTRFRELFGNNPRFTQITETHIKAAIEYMAGSYKRHGNVYFGMDDRFLINYCGHYLIYGSEYMGGLATFIQQQFNYDLKAELRKYGKPTIFKVRIPVTAFSEAELRELASEALRTWAFNMAHNRTYSYELDFGKDFDYSLASDHIIGHYHPNKIPDPLNYRRTYRFDQN